MDEISKRKGHQNFATVIGDIEAGKLIEVIDSHQQEDIIEVLEQQPLEVREQVEEVSVDMWGGFPKVVKKVFPNAVVVIDRFHVIKVVNTELNRIRRQARIVSVHRVSKVVRRIAVGREAEVKKGQASPDAWHSKHR
ncbi:ISL3 family transposase [Egbenema bharatensis]|uniref:ISL3 family transposase n=1 Tax=Egbenema bharatensis TaxID=3463334 RepID=UPI003A8ABDA6